MKLRQIFLVILLVSAKLFAGEYLDINISPTIDTVGSGETAEFSITFTPKNGFNADIDLSTTIGSLSQNTVSPPVEGKTINLTVGADEINHDSDTKITITGKNGTTVLDSAECVLLYDGPLYNFIKFTTSEGLSSDTVYKIEIDSDGNKWFGTYNGLSKYNGYTWETFYTNYSPQITALASDGDSIWICGGYWLDHYTYVNFVRLCSNSDLFECKEFDIGGNVYDIAIDNDGNKWFCNESCIYKYNGDSWTIYTTADGVADVPVKAVAIDGSENPWFATEEGVCKYDGSFWTTYDTYDGLSNNHVESIAIDSNGTKWFGTRNGANNFDGINWKNYYKEEGIVDNYIRSIAIDYNGNKWLGTDGWGVSMFDDTNWTTIYGLANGTIYDIAIEKNGNIWFGTAGGVSVLLNTPMSISDNNYKKNKTTSSHFTISAIVSSSNITIKYRTSFYGKTAFNLYNMLGERVRSISQNSSAGENIVNLSTAGIPNGSYILKIVANDSYVSSKIMIMK